MQTTTTMKGRVHGLALILTAGGLGLRMGCDGPKQFAEVMGRPILALALEPLPDLLSMGLNRVVLSYPAGHRDSTLVFLERLCEKDSRFSLSENSPHAECILECCEGGSTRQGSVLNALKILEPHAPQAVFVHDAVRPLATMALYQRLLDALQNEGRNIVPLISVVETSEQVNSDGTLCGAVPLLAVVDTLKKVDLIDGTLTGTVDREEIFRVQTPQIFVFQALFDLHQRAQEEGFLGTDDASLFEHFAVGSVVGVEGENSNLKLTTPDDLSLAEFWLKEKR